MSSIDDISKKYNIKLDTTSQSAYTSKDYLSIKHYNHNQNTYIIVAISNTVTNAQKLLNAFRNSITFE